jgi:MFS family permease
MNSDDRASTVQFVVNERQDAYSVTKILALLCVVASLEGADNALLPSTIEALIESLGITYWHMGILAVCQAFIQALSAPLWGIMASRGIMDRKKILIIGCIAQGAATVVLSQVKNYPMMIPIRMINGMCLASLRPISYGIVADIIAPERQGKAFGAVMMTNIIGNAIGFLICTPISRVHYTIAGMEVVGWQLAFIGIGGFSMLLGPLLAVTLSVPPVKVGAGAGQTSIADEFRALGEMLSMPTFAALVLQGCFGAIPWQAGTFKTAFFQKIGINDVQSALLGTVVDLQVQQAVSLADLSEIFFHSSTRSMGGYSQQSSQSCSGYQLLTSTTWSSMVREVGYGSISPWLLLRASLQLGLQQGLTHRFWSLSQMHKNAPLS